MKTPEDRKAIKNGLRENTPWHQDANKPPVELIPTAPLESIAHVFGYGAQKYGPHNWFEHRDKWDWTQLTGSCLRHIYAWLRGEPYDRESNIDHLAHAGANILMLLDIIIAQKGRDDRRGSIKTKERGPIVVRKSSITTWHPDAVFDMDEAHDEGPSNN